MIVKEIIDSWKKNVFKPLYWLEGEDDYHIDELVNYAEKNLLTEAEAGFNLMVFYGKDCNWTNLVNAARRYPMFAEKQVVILKEAQQMKEIAMLEGYINKPQPSTIFIVAFKGKTLDKRLKMAKAIGKTGVLFSTKKITDRELPGAIKEIAASQSLTLTEGAVRLIAENIGADLSRISNELEKLALNISTGQKVTEDEIDKYIGISKQYNSFELNDALGRKDFTKALKILQYYEANPKVAPMPLVLGGLYGYFSRLYQVFGLSENSDQAAAHLFYNNVYAAKSGREAAFRYGLEGVEKAILLIHQYNLRSVGINDYRTSQSELLKELVVRIIN